MKLTREGRERWRMPVGLTRSVLLALGALLVAEVVVRAFFHRSMSGRFDYGYHPTAGFVEEADGGLSLVRAGGRRFYPQQYAQNPQSNQFRIMVVGDSVPRGSKLETSYAQQLDRLLDAAGMRAEVWNLAVAGYGARRVGIVLKQALEYQPSLIIYHLNQTNEYEDEREWARSLEFQGWHPKNWVMKSLVVRRLHEMKVERVYWEWLGEDLRNFGAAPGDAMNELKASQDPETLKRWNATVESELARSVQSCLSEGVKVLLISQARIALDSEGNKVLKKDPLLHALAERWTGAQVMHLSMEDALVRESNPGALFADSSHLTPEGHAVLARAIQEKIQGQRPSQSHLPGRALSSGPALSSASGE